MQEKNKSLKEKPAAEQQLNNSVENEITETLKGYTQEIDVTKEEIKNDAEITPGVQPVKVETRGRKKKKLFTEAEQPLKTLAASDLISGALFLLFIDLLIPNVLCFANNRFSKKKIKVKSMQLTESQKTQLEPLANEAAKQMMLKGNPVTVFIIALAGIYGLNFMMLKNE